MVAAEAARASAEAAACRAQEAHAAHDRLEPLRAAIRAEIPLALARLDRANFAGGQMLRVDRPRLIGKQYVERAGWELGTHPIMHKGEMMQRTTWLLSDGRLLGGAPWRDPLDDETDEAVLRDILANLRGLARRSES